MGDLAHVLRRRGHGDVPSCDLFVGHWGRRDPGLPDPQANQPEDRHDHQDPDEDPAAIIRGEGTDRDEIVVVVRCVQGLARQLLELSDDAVDLRGRQGLGVRRPRPEERVLGVLPHLGLGDRVIARVHREGRRIGRLAAIAGLAVHAERVQERVSEGLRGRGTIGDPLRQGPHHRGLEARGDLHRGVLLRKGGRRLLHVLHQDRDRRLPVEGGLAHEHLVEHHAEGVEVRPMVELDGVGLLGAQVARGAEDHPRLGLGLVVPRTLAMPKSRIFAWSWPRLPRVMITFSGFMSRCQIPWPWASERE